MKKIYLILLAVTVGFSSFGQHAKQNTIPFKSYAINKSVKSPTQSPQDKGAVLWSDDFSVPANWVMTNTSSPAADWVITTDVNASPAGAGLNPAGMSTAANGYALIDSDTPGAGATQNATITMVTPVDLTGQPSVSLVFEQTTRRYVEVTTVRVSGDNGANWTDYVVNSQMAANSNSPNPETISVNISATAGNQSQVLIAFHYLAAWDWFWAVDDVSIQVSDDNDLIVYNEYYGTFFVPYTRIPVDQIQPIDFAIEAENVGAVAQTNTILTADINSGVFTGTSAPVTIAPGATDSLFTTTQFTPPVTTGVSYAATLTVSSDSVDATPVNNSFAFPPFEVSQYIYAMDDYGTAGNGGGYDGNTTPPLEEFEAGNFYDIFTNAQVYAIDVVIGTSADIGSAIDVVLYEWTGATPVQVDRSNPYVVVSGDLGTTKTILLPTAPSLVAGNTYFAAVHAFGGGSEFFYGISGNSPDGSGAAAQTSLISYPDMVNGTQNYYTSQTPMIRMNFDPNVGVNELDANSINFNVYPNPSAGEFNINLTSNEVNNVELTVKNVVGKTIINKTVAVAGKTIETISLSDYSKGIYFLTINNETVKLIVE